MRSEDEKYLSEWNCGAADKAQLQPANYDYSPPSWKACCECKSPFYFVAETGETAPIEPKVRFIPAESYANTMDDLVTEDRLRTTSGSTCSNLM